MKNLSRGLVFTYKSTPFKSLAANALIIPLFSAKDGKAILPNEIKEFDKTVSGAIKLSLTRKDFTGKRNSAHLILLNGKIERIVLAGIGEKNKISPEIIRQAISSAVNSLKNTSCEAAAVFANDLEFTPAPKSSFYEDDEKIINSNNKNFIKNRKDNHLVRGFIDAQNLGQIISESVLLSSYEFTRYKKSGGGDKKRLKRIIVLGSENNLKGLEKGSRVGQKIAEAVNLARDLANEPANIVTPTTLAKSAKAVAKKNKIKCRILEKGDMKKMGMGALLGVAQGSAELPKFIILEYFPKFKVQSSKFKIPTIVMVGKGITFDSGGISIKPSQSLDEMKYDMAGGAAVIGIMQAAARLELPIRLVGLIPSTENLPSGSAQRPGDIVRAMNGKTIEVLNTDAEGRMILADALVYAKKYKPSAVLDLATLTGAIVVALGSQASGLFSNNEKLKKSLADAGDKTGERVWPMPLYDEYFEQIKGDLADIKNVGGKEAGASTAAKFLEQFTDYPWAHIDIAGTAWTTSPKPCKPKGATGIGVRLVVEFLRNRTEDI